MKILSEQDQNIKNEIKQKMDLQTRKNFKKCIKDAVSKELENLMRNPEFIKSFISQECSKMTRQHIDARIVEIKNDRI